jgi:hypothetical protein
MAYLLSLLAFKKAISAAHMVATITTRLSSRLFRIFSLNIGDYCCILYEYRVPGILWAG